MLPDEPAAVSAIPVKNSSTPGTPLHDPDRALALGFVSTAARPGMAALWGLDERLGDIVARAGEPTIALMRLVWWRDRLEALSTGAPAEPLLAACAAAGLDGAALAAMTAGWEALLDDPATGDDTIERHATKRGAGLFLIAGGLLGAGGDAAALLADAGGGWALADLARRLRDTRAEAVRAAARVRLDRAMARRWPRRLRPLGALAMLAAADLRHPLGPRRRALRLSWFQIAGR